MRFALKSRVAFGLALFLATSGFAAPSFNAAVAERLDLAFSEEFNETAALCSIALGISAEEASAGFFYWGRIAEELLGLEFGAGFMQADGVDYSAFFAAWGFNLFFLRTTAVVFPSASGDALAMLRVGIGQFDVRVRCRTPDLKVFSFEGISIDMSEQRLAELKLRVFADYAADVQEFTAGFYTLSWMLRDLAALNLPIKLVAGESFNVCFAPKIDFNLGVFAAVAANLYVDFHTIGAGLKLSTSEFSTSIGPSRLGLGIGYNDFSQEDLIPLRGKWMITIRASVILKE